MKRTFIDAGVLISAARGTDAVATKALQILDDPDREFASSVFVRLEVLPKSIYFKRENEIQFYETFFDAVVYWTNNMEVLTSEAYREACATGLSAMDALHVAAAKLVGADELVTTESVDKPLHRAISATFTVVSIRP